MRWLLRSKIHKATVTDANVEYVGSISIDEELLELTGLWPHEKVMVSSNTTGARLETYIIKAPRNSGTICLNGAAAHLIKRNEEIIIMGFELTEKLIEPKCILVNAQNQFLYYL